MPVGCCVCIHHRQLLLLVVTHAESRYSCYTEDGRLSRPRHCTVPNAVYHSGCRHKYNFPSVGLLKEFSELPISPSPRSSSLLSPISSASPQHLVNPQFFTAPTCFCGCTNSIRTAHFVFNCTLEKPCTIAK